MITPFFPSADSFFGSYVYDQINEICKQSEFHIEIVKLVSFFSTEKDYIFKGFRVSVFKVIDIPFLIKKFKNLFLFILLNSPGKIKNGKSIVLKILTLKLLNS